VKSRIKRAGICRKEKWEKETHQQKHDDHNILAKADFMKYPIHWFANQKIFFLFLIRISAVRNMKKISYCSTARYEPQLYFQ
jgi:hypothetical protein